MTGHGEEKEKCINPKAGDADLWINIWKELHNLAAGDFLVEVVHVKAHCTKKEKKEMSHFGTFVTEGNEKADALAKEGAMLDEGFMTEARAKTIAAGVEKRCMQPCSMQPAFTALWKNGRTVKSSSRSRKKSGPSWTRKARRRNIERSGVLRPTSIDS